MAPRRVSLDTFAVEATTPELAAIAGEALAQLRVGKEHTIDAIVMASAATRGDVVYTSDYDDLARLGVCYSVEKGEVDLLSQLVAREGHAADDELLVDEVATLLLAGHNVLHHPRL